MISLGTQVGPVESPFTPEQQQRFDAGLERAIAKYPSERRKAALLAALHLAQDELGWVSEPAMAELVNNDTFYEHVTAESLKALIRDLREQPGKAMAKGPLPRLPDPHARIESQSTPQATGTLGQPAVTTRAEAGSTEPKR